MLDFNSNPLTCKTAPFSKSEKTNRVFAGKGRGGRTLVLAYLDSPMAKVLPHIYLVFFILAIFRGYKVRGQS